MFTRVKKAVLSIIPLFVAAALAAAPAQAQLGVAAGYGFNVLNQPGFSSSAQNTFKSPGGVNVSLFYDFPIGPVALRPGLSIRQSSFEWDLEEVSFSPIESSIRVAEIPIDLRYNFPRAWISPYVLAGPGFNFVHTNRPELRQVMDSPKGTTYFPSINIGAGVEIPFVRLGLKLLPELRYGHALSGFLQEEYIVRTVPFESDSAQRMSNLTFRLGISFLSIE